MSNGKNVTQRKGSEDLLDQALKNLEEDRDRLVGFLSKNVDSEDPLVIGVIAENIAKITDVLTKQAMQIIEMAKIRRKPAAGASSEDEDGPLSKGDHDDIYREIEGKEMLS